jgi:hypothetical protein
MIRAFGWVDVSMLKACCEIVKIKAGVYNQYRDFADLFLGVRFASPSLLMTPFLLECVFFCQ